VLIYLLSVPDERLFATPGLGPYMTGGFVAVADIVADIVVVGTAAVKNIQAAYRDMIEEQDKDILLDTIVDGDESKVN
jgi:hypothetical protein